MSLFRFVLLTLTCFRFTRLIVTDKFPPTKLLREWVQWRMGDKSGWYQLVTCPWCMGAWVTGAVYAVDYFWRIPTILLMVAATMALVGFLGTYDGRP